MRLDPLQQSNDVEDRRGSSGGMMGGGTGRVGVGGMILAAVAYFVFGILLIWAGILFRFWSIRTLGNLISTRLVIQERHALITTGPYKYIRNPSYTGALITFMGFGLGTGNWLSAAVFLCAGLLAYARRIRTEESMLLEQFGGEFEEYKKRTWALIPFVW